MQSNLQSLCDRAKSGDHYRAPPVRRVHIPKGDGRKTRPIEVVESPEQPGARLGAQRGNGAALRYFDEFRRPRYSDVGLILYGPLRSFGVSPEAFRSQASRLIVAFGAHRLGTGVAVELLINPDYRRVHLGQERSFERSRGLVELAFRVDVGHDPDVERVEVLFDSSKC